MSMRQYKNKKSERRTVCHNIITKNMHKASLLRSTAVIAWAIWVAQGWRHVEAEADVCPPGEAARCSSPGWGEPTPLQGAGRTVLTMLDTRDPQSPIPPHSPGWGPGCRDRCGSPWLRQSCCCCVHTPWWHRGSGGLISCSLLNSSKCRNLFSLFNFPSRRTDSKKG